MKPTKAGLPYMIIFPLVLLLFLGGSMRLFAYLTEEHHDLSTDVPTHNRKSPRRPIPAPAPPAEPVDAATQQALEKTAAGQVDAFSRNDFVEALRFSDDAFRSQSTPDSFRILIQSRYAPLMTAKKKTFEHAEQRGSIVTLPVTVFDTNGAKAKFVYFLKAIGTGKEWQVAGCQPVMPVISSQMAMPVPVK